MGIGSDLEKRDANYQPLTPISFLYRTASVFPNKAAIQYGAISRSYKQELTRCEQLAQALLDHGIQPGETISILAPNIPETWEAHFGIPMMGGVLNAINTRLDSASIEYILLHSETKLLIYDSEFRSIVKDALQNMETAPDLVEITDTTIHAAASDGVLNFEDFIHVSITDFEPVYPDDEWTSISINYTSGTTGQPKGVVYSHRGAYMNAIGNVLAWDMPKSPKYLWTLPMFHCNGWCFPWTIAERAGTHICLRQINGKNIVDALCDQGITHLCGAPIVMQMIVDELNASPRSWPQNIHMMTAAAPPPETVLKAMNEAGIHVTHVYGLTEVYGPAVICEWQEEWADLQLSEQAVMQARQGVPYPVEEGVMVADPETMQPVPQDGETIGEVMIRGNIAMKGYLKNKEATDAAFKGGWFHTGDLGVWHGDQYVQLKDRSKDIIISGGENISSIEIEDAIYKHEAVAAVGVVAKPDEKWGETPCAYIELKSGMALSAEELIQHCRDNLASYKIPKDIRFEEIPKTNTGKIQKFLLRERVRKSQ